MQSNSLTQGLQRQLISSGQEGHHSLSNGKYKTTFIAPKHLWEFSKAVGPVNLLLITSLFSWKILHAVCSTLSGTGILSFPNASWRDVPSVDSWDPSISSHPTRHPEDLVIYVLCHTSKQVYRLREYIHIYLKLKIACQVSTKYNSKCIRSENCKVGFIKA